MAEISWNPDRITKLKFDALAFLSVAEKSNKLLIGADLLESALPDSDPDRPLRNSIERESQITAMIFNFGVSLELTLKLLHIKSIGRYKRTHSYFHLFSELSKFEEVKDYLEYRYSCHFLFPFQLGIGGHPLTTPESSSQNDRFDTLEKTLKYLDQIGLYEARYSSEKFVGGAWRKEPYPLDGWIDFLKEVLEYSKSISFSQQRADLASP